MASARESGGSPGHPAGKLKRGTGREGPVLAHPATDPKEEASLLVLTPWLADSCHIPSQALCGHLTTLTQMEFYLQNSLA